MLNRLIYILVCLGLYSCAGYYDVATVRYPHDYDENFSLYDDQTNYWILHLGDEVKHIENVKYVKGIFSGTEASFEDYHQIYLQKPPRTKDNWQVYQYDKNIYYPDNELHVYVSKVSSGKNGMVHIDINDIYLVEDYESGRKYKVGRTKGIWLFGVALLGVFFSVI